MQDFRGCVSKLSDGTVLHCFFRHELSGIAVFIAPPRIPSPHAISIFHFPCYPRRTALTGQSCCLGQTEKGVGFRVTMAAWAFGLCFGAVVAVRIAHETHLQAPSLPTRSLLQHIFGTPPSAHFPESYSLPKPQSPFSPVLRLPHPPPAHAPRLPLPLSSNDPLQISLNPPPLLQAPLPTSPISLNP